MPDDKSNLEAALAALAGDNLNEKSKTNNNVGAQATNKHYHIFKSSILACYIQGRCSPLFLESSLPEYEKLLASSDVENEKIKAFLSPLFLLLHGNKNIIFRPYNLRLLSLDARQEFDLIINEFRKSSRLVGFLSTYKVFLNFLKANQLNVTDGFTSLQELLIPVHEYRQEAIAQDKTPAAPTYKDIDLDALSFD